MQIFTAEGLLFLLRWIHFLSGITWIGLLYYFNFVQVPFFAETEPPVRSGAIQKLVPRALLWFRMGAMMTFVSGWFIIGGRMSQMGAEFFNASYGWFIFTGGILGSIMWANVWFVIWPNQKVVIANAVQTAAGGQPIPDAAARGRRAFIASRTNTLLSIPMLFFMGAASHLILSFPKPAAGATAAMALCLAIVFLLIEVNVLVGTKGPLKKPLETIKGTIVSGFLLAAILYLLFEAIF